MKNRYFKIHKQQNRVLVIGARHSDFLVFKENVIQHLSSSIESNTDYNIQLEEVIEGDDVSYSFQPISSISPVKFELIFKEEDYYKQEIESNNIEVSFDDLLRHHKPHFAIVMINMNEINFNGLSGQLQFYIDHSNNLKVIPSFLILNFEKFISIEIKQWCIENDFSLTTYIFERLGNRNSVPLEIMKKEKSDLKNLLRELNRFYIQNRIDPNNFVEFSKYFKVFSSNASVNLFIQNLFQIILSTDLFNNYHFENLISEKL